MHYPGNCLNILRKTTKNLNQYSGSNLLGFIQSLPKTVRIVDKSQKNSSSRACLLPNPYPLIINDNILVSLLSTQMNLHSVPCDSFCSVYRSLQVTVRDDMALNVHSMQQRSSTLDVIGIVPPGCMLHDFRFRT
jgi:hypothetical protein